MSADAPSGVSMTWKNDRLRVALKDVAILRVVYAVVAALLVPLAIILLTKPSLVWLDIHPVEWFLVVPLWGLITLVLFHLFMRETVVVITPEQVKVIHLPWFLPLTFKHPTEKLRLAEIDTRIKEHKDKYGNVISTTYIFNVELSFTDIHNSPTVFKTTDEAQAVYLQNMVNYYLSDD
jgi:hypothetical protein